MKAWERNEEGVFLIKAAEHSGGVDIQGVKLASDLCTSLFEEDRFVPVSIVERHGRVCSASPLMLASNEELINGNQLHAIAGVPEGPLVYGRMFARARKAALGRISYGIAGQSVVLCEWSEVLKCGTPL